MRAVRRADWFSVVATDLFCGALGAIIILDAATPRNPRATEGLGNLSMSYTVENNGDCQETLIVAQLTVSGGSKSISSLGSDRDASGDCRKTIDLQELEGLTLDKVLLAKGPSHVEVRFTSRVKNWTCWTKTGECK